MIYTWLNNKKKDQGTPWSNLKVYFRKKKKYTSLKRDTWKENDNENDIGILNHTTQK